MALYRPLLAAVATAALIAGCVPPRATTGAPSIVAGTAAAEETTVGELPEAAPLPARKPVLVNDPNSPFGPVDLFPTIGPSVMGLLFF